VSIDTSVAPRRLGWRLPSGASRDGSPAGRGRLIHSDRRVGVGGSRLCEAADLHKCFHSKALQLIAELPEAQYGRRRDGAGILSQGAACRDDRRRSGASGQGMKQSIDPSYEVLAARNIRKQAKALSRQIDGTRTAEDVEYLHQARVASRRLRAALSTFRDCWPGRTFRKWRKQIRQLTTALGPARDMDVQVQYVERILAELPEDKRPCRAGVARLLLRLRQRREALQPRVVRALDRLEGSGVLKEMRSATDQVLTGQEDSPTLAASAFVFEQAREHIVRRLYKLMGYQGSLADPGDQQRHHRMRVAAKRLRYTMELFKPVYQDTVDETIAAVKQMQTLLGAVHDSDIWTEDFQRFRDEEQERTRQYFGHSRPFKRLAPGIDYLVEHQREVREQAFAELKRRWGELQDAQVWERLIQTLDSHIDRTEPGDEPRGEAHEDSAGEQAAS